MALITARDVSLGYNGNTVVSGLNFTVKKGDYLFIVGENGSGKSTLMKTILHLYPALMSGEITFGEGLMQQDIGYLPQQTDFQRDFPASVREIVLSGALGHCGLSPFYSREQKVQAEEYMGKVGILQLASRCYRELSGGQQQRVLLARALMAAREVILLDEPVTGLDPKAASEMYSIIKHLNDAHKMTIIMISHDIEAAKTYASHILHIGNPMFFGRREDYKGGESII